MMHRNAPYNSLLAASASSSSSFSSSFSSSSSLWSGPSSQHSDDTSWTAPTSDSDSCDSYYLPRTLASSQTSISSFGSFCDPATKLREPWPKHQIPAQPQVELPAGLRQNPRRTCTSVTSRSGRPPSLVRQSDRKINFVDNLVGKQHSRSAPRTCAQPPSLFRHVHPYRRGDLAYVVGPTPQ